MMISVPRHKNANVQNVVFVCRLFLCVPTVGCERCEAARGCEGRECEGCEWRVMGLRWVCEGGVRGNAGVVRGCDGGDAFVE